MPTPSAGRSRLALSVIGALALVTAIAVDVQASSVFTHGSRDRPWVALTFDDGWSAGRCEQIVRTLRAKQVPATFFINGAIIRQAPARWRAMLQGFEVANHTLTHPYLTRLSATQIAAQIRVNEQVIESALGRPMLRVLRPPYGAYDSRVVQVADSLGYRTLLWDVDSLDTRTWATTGSVIRYGSRGGKGAIVLMHCGPSATPGAVGPIIESYRARGYRLVGLSQMLGLGGEPVEPPAACRVKNLDTGVINGNLQIAVDAARPGQHLTVRGRCRGPVEILGDITIRGVRRGSSGPPTVVGKGQRAVVKVPAARTRVTITGLTIRGGASAGDGGGIRNRGALVLRDVIVRGNTAAGRGGGIFNLPGGTLTLDGSSSVRGNSAADGGGVWNAGVLRLDGASSISGNTAGQGTAAGLLNQGQLVNVMCVPPGANVHGNSPGDCGP